MLFGGKIGYFLIKSDPPQKAQAIVVLSGIDYYARLIQASNLYKDKLAPIIIINGGRRSEALERLIKTGFDPPCKWPQKSIAVLNFLGVPLSSIWAIRAPNAYDTVSEAKTVGKEIIKRGINHIILTTSNFHTKRASYIWKTIYKGRLKITTIPAKGPFDPKGWWKSPRQIRWIIYEYGAWIFYFISEAFN